MKYKVSGYCFVPHEAQGIIEADSEEQAIQIAKRRFRQGPSEYLVVNSQDERAAFDWEPTAVALENNEVSR